MLCHSVSSSSLPSDIIWPYCHPFHTGCPMLRIGRKQWLRIAFASALSGAHCLIETFHVLVRFQRYILHSFLCRVALAVLILFFILCVMELMWSQLWHLSWVCSHPRFLIRGRIHLRLRVWGDAHNGLFGVSVNIGAILAFPCRDGHYSCSSGVYISIYCGCGLTFKNNTGAFSTLLVAPSLFLIEIAASGQIWKCVVVIFWPMTTSFAVS